MSDQLSLLGFEEAARPTDRLFFALFPDAATAERIGALAHQLRGDHRLQGRPLAAERFHVTLHHLGDYAGVPAGIVACAHEAALALAAEAFEVVFDRASSFAGRPQNRPFVLRGGEGVAALAAFQKALGLAMMKAGLGKRVEGNFTPHVTLLYDDQIVADQAIEPIAWTAGELVLVHSLLGKTQHLHICRWPLKGATQP